MRSRKGELLGTVFLPRDDGDVGADDLFIHQCAFPFSYNSASHCSLPHVPPECQGKRKRLAFFYNLAMPKDSIRGRDRVGLPLQWDTALTNLIKAAGPELWDRMLQLDDSFYEIEFHIVKYLNQNRIRVSRSCTKAARIAWSTAGAYAAATTRGCRGS